MDNYTFAVQVFQILLTAYLAYVFNRKIDQLRHAGDRSLHAYKWYHDKQRSREEELLQLVENASTAVRETRHVQHRLRQLKEWQRRKEIYEAYERVDALHRFMQSCSPYLDAEIREVGRELLNNYSMERVHICLEIDKELSGELTRVEEDCPFAIYKETDPSEEQKWVDHEQQTNSLRENLAKLIEEKATSQM